MSQSTEAAARRSSFLTGIDYGGVSIGEQVVRFEPMSNARGVLRSIGIVIWQSTFSMGMTRGCPYNGRVRVRGVTGGNEPMATIFEKTTQGRFMFTKRYEVVRLEFVR